ncbi:MAG: nucleotidyltransferase family protein [Chloroflexi bacterium]|nr:nucleotidyltransferase family protein [Chloroflexota bacterium]
MGSVVALLLTAGESTRMGDLKALLPWQGASLLSYQVSTLQQAGINPIVVVLGHRAQELESQLPAAPGVRQVHNPNYLKGKTTSIKAGLNALQPHEIDAVLVLNVDQPRTATTIKSIVDEHHRHTPLITIPTYRGKGGHPVILSSTLLDELMGISEESLGLKAVVHKHRKETHFVEMDSDEVLLDLNLEEDYRRAFEKFGAG